MTRAAWAPAAVADLQAIERRWSDERPDYLVRLLDEITSATVRLDATPGLGTPLKARGRRKFRLGRTPYLLVYSHTGAGLRILRLHHERQNWRTP